MKKFAVAFVDFAFKNDLQIKFVEAEDWRQALNKTFGPRYLESESLEDAKEEAFNQDWLFDVKEIK